VQANFNTQSLIVFQVFYGVKIQRYETYVGDAEGYPSAGVKFTDKLGKKILQLEGLNFENYSLGKQLKLYFKYPFEFIGIYTRHIVNGLTPIFLECYIKNIYTNKSVPFAINVVLFFVILLSLFSKYSTNVSIINYIKQENNIIYLLMFVPVLLVSFGSVEARFYIFMYVCMYTYIFYIINYISLLNFVKKHLILVLLLFVFFLSIWSAIITQTLSDGQYDVFLLNNKINNFVEK
jgi:hypothetical protein